MGIKKILLFASFAAVITSFPLIRAEAATVGSISISVTDGELVPGDPPAEPVIETAASGCEVVGAEWSKNVDRWKPGERIRVMVTLSSSDLEFDSFYNRNKCRVTGKNASYVSAKRQDDPHLLDVHIDYYPSVALGETDEAGWTDITKTVARWSKVPYATGYRVELYADDKKVKTVDVKTNSVDLSQYMTKEAVYYYEVKAVGATSEDKKYRKEGEFITSDDIILDDLGDTDGRWKTGRNGLQYRGSDGKYVKNDWRYIVGKWYCFDAEGYVMTGWNYMNGSWYYMDSNGVMRTGWIQPKGKDTPWYFLYDDGRMAVGWAEASPGSWYYFDGSGVMLTGWIQPGGVWYYLDGDGKMLTGWREINGRTYYFHDNGAMQSGPMTGSDGRTYQFDSGGALIQ